MELIEIIKKNRDDSKTSLDAICRELLERKDFIGLSERGIKYQTEYLIFSKALKSLEELENDKEAIEYLEENIKNLTDRLILDSSRSSSLYFDYKSECRHEVYKELRKYYLDFLKENNIKEF